MFDNIISFFKKINKKEEEKTTNKDTAKERLHLVLMQDRANVSADFLDMMKQEIIDVIKKYVDVEESEIDVKLTNKQNGDGTVGAPALYANIPIRGIKNESRKLNKPEENTNKKEENQKQGENSITKKENNKENDDNTTKVDKKDNEKEIEEKTNLKTPEQEPNKIIEKKEVSKTIGNKEENPIEKEIIKKENNTVNSQNSQKKNVSKKKKVSKVKK